MLCCYVVLLCCCAARSTQPANENKKPTAHPNTTTTTSAAAPLALAKKPAATAAAAGAAPAPGAAPSSSSSSSAAASATAAAPRVGANGKPIIMEANRNSDNYEMSDHEDDCDEETDVDDDSKGDGSGGGGANDKRIPLWARTPAIEQQLQRQEAIDPDTIFPPVNTCNLDGTARGLCVFVCLFVCLFEAILWAARDGVWLTLLLDVCCPPTEIFAGYRKKRRFQQRTSSGNWLADRLHWKEEVTYKQTMGYL